MSRQGFGLLFSYIRNAFLHALVLSIKVETGWEMGVGTSARKTNLTMTTLNQ